MKRTKQKVDEYDELLTGYMKLSPEGVAHLKKIRDCPKEREANRARMKAYNEAMASLLRR